MFLKDLSSLFCATKAEIMAFYFIFYFSKIEEIGKIADVFFRVDIDSIMFLHFFPFLFYPFYTIDICIHDFISQFNI